MSADFFIAASFFNAKISNNPLKIKRHPIQRESNICANSIFYSCGKAESRAGAFPMIFWDFATSDSW